MTQVMPHGMTPDADPPPTGLAARIGMTAIIRQCLALLGLFLIILSVPVGMLTPFLPIGLPIGIAGVVLLGRNAVWGRRWMERVLARHPRVERLAPNWLMKAVFGREKNTDKS